MDKFLSDKRLLVFLGAMLIAIGGWGASAAKWVDLMTPAAIFGLVAILGGVLLSNVTNNVFKTPPVITETTKPETITTVTTTTPPENK